MDAKEALELRRRQILERLSPEQVRIEPGYHTLREEILRPDRLEAETAYFWDHWAPRLGPSAAILIVRMRQACRRAGAFDGQDAAVVLSYAEIARFCGLSVSTVKRLLGQEDVRRFIRKEAQMRASTIGMVDAPNRYVVMMTDPLDDTDEIRLRDRLADRLLTQELLGAPGAPHSSASTPSSPPSGVHHGPVTPVKDGLATPAQIEPVTQASFAPPSQAQNEQNRLRERPSLLTSRRGSAPLPNRPVMRKVNRQNVETVNDINVNNVDKDIEGDRSGALKEPNAVPEDSSDTGGAPGYIMRGEKGASEELPPSRTTGDRKKGPETCYVEGDRIEEWAIRMVEATGDEASINFYRKAARILLQRKADGVLDHALGIVKEAIQDGRARRPAALLTATLITLAEERGIFITERKRREAESVRSVIRRAFDPE